MSDLTGKAHRRHFLNLPFLRHKDHPLWVRPSLLDAGDSLDPIPHLFNEHSEVDFFLASRKGDDLGRIAVLHSTPCNPSMMEKTVREAGFQHAGLTPVAGNVARPGDAGWCSL